MKKFITVISLVLAIMMLASCAPASSYVEVTTEKPTGILGTPDVGTTSEFKDYTVCSTNYAMYTGEYYYFFFTYLSEFVKNYSADKLAELNFDPDTSLKEQYVKDGSKTWYDFFKEITVEYMEKILLSCEAARKTDSSYAKEAKDYVNAVKSELTSTAKQNGITLNELIYQLYGGNVSTQSYLNALQMEYICNAYYADKYAELYGAITLDEAKTYSATLEGEKDTTLTKNIAFVTVDDGEAKAKALFEAFTANESKSKDTLKALADEGEYQFGTVENNTPSSITEKKISEWLFAKERQIGDSAHIFVEGDGHYVLYYYGDGYEYFVSDAMKKLAEKKIGEYYSSLKSQYNLKYDEEKLDGLNA